MSYRRIPVTTWLRLKSGKAVGFGAFVVALGIAGAMITAVSSTQTRVPWKYIGIAAFFCLLIGVGAAYIRGHTKLIPDAFVDEICSDVHYACLPCTTEGLRVACEMTRPYYGHEYVPSEIVEQWRLKNPNSLMQIVNSDGEICAAFGVLALNDSFLDQFIAGRVSDGQLTADCICTLEDSKRSSRLYLSGVVVKDPLTYGGAKRARIMTWAILKYLKEFYGLRRTRTLFALAVTKESERLMKNLSFELVGRAKHRVDRCNMYKYTLSKKSWDGLLRRIGDFSRMVDCEF